MAYHSASLRLAVYLVLLTAFSGVLFLLVKASSWYALLPALGIVATISGIYNLFNSVPEKIAYFFNAIENEDSTLHFSEKTRHKPTREMHRSLNRVNNLIQEAKLKNREQEQYYSTLLEQVVTGIVVMNEKGVILQANSAAKRLLDYEPLTHIEQLKRVDINLYQAFFRLKQESAHYFVRVTHHNSVRQLSLQATTFKSRGNTLRIISIHDISNELDAKEIESWQKLIRVLTHEIMNSITPITSLSETLLKYFLPLGKNIDEKTAANTVMGLQVINERCSGLIRFVETYRKLTKLAEPVLQPLVIKDLIEHLLLLLENEPGFGRIRFVVQTECPNLTIDADEAQLSQVMINLLKNAMQAVEGVSKPRITVSAYHNKEGRCEITVADNGPGIAPEVMEQIFVPFFTTREKGSGIGLSLARQIMKNHGGTIEATSSPGETAFTLCFQ